MMGERREIKARNGEGEEGCGRKIERLLGREGKGKMRRM